MPEENRQRLRGYQKKYRNKKMKILNFIIHKNT